MESFAECNVNVCGDYGLNLYNSRDFLLAKTLDIKEAVVAHEAELRDILEMDFHGIIPEVVIKGKIPVMTSEHCLVGDLNFCTCNEEEDQYYLKDRKGQFYPILTSSKACQNMILSHKDTNLLKEKNELKNAGIKRFRINVE